MNENPDELGAVAPTTPNAAGVGGVSPRRYAGESYDEAVARENAPLNGRTDRGADTALTLLAEGVKAAHQCRDGGAFGDWLPRAERFLDDNGTDYRVIPEATLPPGMERIRRDVARADADARIAERDAVDRAASAPAENPEPV